MSNATATPVMNFTCCGCCDHPDSLHGDDRREGHANPCPDGCNDAQASPAQEA
jgi:hypothetical protein